MSPRNYKWMCPDLGQPSWVYCMTGNVTNQSIAEGMVSRWAARSEITPNNVEVFIDNEVWVVHWTPDDGLFKAVRSS